MHAVFAQRPVETDRVLNIWTATAVAAAAEWLAPHIARWRENESHNMIDCSAHYCHLFDSLETVRMNRNPAAMAR